MLLIWQELTHVSHHHSLINRSVCHSCPLETRPQASYICKEEEKCFVRVARQKVLWAQNIFKVLAFLVKTPELVNIAQAFKLTSPVTHSTQCCLAFVYFLTLCILVVLWWLSCVRKVDTWSAKEQACPHLPAFMQVIPSPGINAHRNRACCAYVCLREIQETTQILICPRPWTSQESSFSLSLGLNLLSRLFPPATSKCPSPIQYLQTSGQRLHRGSTAEMGPVL